MRKLLISEDTPHNQFLSYDDFISKVRIYFYVKDIYVYWSGKGLKSKSPKIVSRNIFCDYV